MLKSLIKREGFSTGRSFFSGHHAAITDNYSTLACQTHASSKHPPTPASPAANCCGSLWVFGTAAAFFPLFLYLINMTITRERVLRSAVVRFGRGWARSHRLSLVRTHQIKTPSGPFSLFPIYLAARICTQIERLNIDPGAVACHFYQMNICYFARESAVMCVWRLNPCQIIIHSGSSDVVTDFDIRRKSCANNLQIKIISFIELYKKISCAQRNPCLDY